MTTTTKGDDEMKYSNQDFDEAQLADIERESIEDEYSRQMALCRHRITLLQNRLAKHWGLPSKHWGHVGDVAHLAEQLNEMAKGWRMEP